MQAHDCSQGISLFFGLVFSRFLFLCMSPQWSTLVKLCSSIFLGDFYCWSSWNRWSLVWFDFFLPSFDSTHTQHIKINVLLDGGMNLRETKWWILGETGWKLLFWGDSSFVYDHSTFDVSREALVAMESMACLTTLSFSLHSRRDLIESF